MSKLEGQDAAYNKMPCRCPRMQAMREQLSAIDADLRRMSDDLIAAQRKLPPFAAARSSARRTGGNWERSAPRSR